MIIFKIQNNTVFYQEYQCVFFSYGQRTVSIRCTYVEILTFMGPLVHNVRNDPVDLDKVQFATKAPIYTISSRLHQKFSPTQIHHIKYTENFSERSKSSHSHQKFLFVQPFTFRFFSLIIDFFSKIPVNIFFTSLLKKIYTLSERFHKLFKKNCFPVSTYVRTYTYVCLKYPR